MSSSDSLTQFRTQLTAASLGVSDVALRESLINAVLRDAPAELVSTRGVSGISSVVLRMATVVASHTSGATVEGFSDEFGDVLVFVSHDRPFIVTSITETLRDFDTRPALLLHPIIDIGSLALSVSYIEIPRLPQGQLGLLVEQLRRMGETLLTVTDDFKAMQDVVSSASAALVRARRVEEGSFLSYLLDETFIFLGVKQGTKRCGLLRATPSLLPPMHEPVEESCAVTKLVTRSPIHRRRRLLTISCRLPGTGESLLIVGCFTSRALSEESAHAPWIRERFSRLVGHFGAREHSHNYKTIEHLVDHMPKGELLRFPDSVLTEIVASTIAVEFSHETRVVLYEEASLGALSVIVIVPRDRYSGSITKDLRRALEEYLGQPPRSAEFHSDVSHKPTVRLYFHVPVISGEVRDTRALTEILIARSLSWSERLRQRLAERTNGSFELLATRYHDAFPDEYRSVSEVGDALEDILCCEQLGEAVPVTVDLRRKGDETILSVFSTAAEMTVSAVVPTLERFGLVVVSERAFTLFRFESTPVQLQRFVVRRKDGVALVLSPEAMMLLVDVLSGRAIDDDLSSLTLTGELPRRAVEVLRLYLAYLWQVDKVVARRTMIGALVTHPEIAVLLWKLFVARFSPTAGNPDGGQSCLEQIFDELVDVTDISIDRVLRNLAKLIMGSVRTNAFAGSPETIAVKVRGGDLDVLPAPRPFAEIFVHGPRVEGVHIRMGSVARGGLRWSDRVDDYRAEVLGLVKTQRIKNVVIVPTGSKGGFFVKQPPADRGALSIEVRRCYQEYIRALLSITDTRQGDTIVAPADVVRHDGDDPYLVVAADKGTATFSDTANEIATKERPFWLGDAFASGGSQGYDHKKYGITARGAWECVLRHFRDCGIDEHAPFSVIGIGDMSGDVFGNGLLLSPHAKLIAAFNHAHIFIDPNPDLQSAMAERQRLFALKGSQWSDYNGALISAGGGVFRRSEKQITITPQMRLALGIPDREPGVMNGEQLIRHILCAPVDLLWNGGIGTYVKASSESHADVNDSTNDRVRISAPELRARVVAEGGNLGFTQRGRIEFARCGGRINTDAIDNSAGVDLSDHEVNLKLLLAEPLRRGTLAMADRNALLERCAADVVREVLAHNRGHAIALSFAEERSRRGLDFFRELQKFLVKLGLLNRDLDALPDDDDLAERAAKREGLTRPELAVLLAGTKMWLKEELIAAGVGKDHALEELLVRYFPRAAVERFPHDVSHHPLREHIIITELLNLMHEFIGVTFIHRTSVVRGVSSASVCRALMAAFLVLDGFTVRDQLWQLDRPGARDEFRERWHCFARALRDMAVWFLATHRDVASVDELVATYQRPVRALLTSQRPEGTWTDRIIALSSDMRRLLEVVRIALNEQVAFDVVAPYYEAVIGALNIRALVSGARGIGSGSRFDQDLVLLSVEAILAALRKIVGALVRSGGHDGTERFTSDPAIIGLQGMITEATEMGWSPAALAIISQRLGSIAETRG